MGVGKIEQRGKDTNYSSNGGHCCYQGYLHDLRCLDRESNLAYPLPQV